jgi:hypothetical protein
MCSEAKRKAAQSSPRLTSFGSVLRRPFSPHFAIQFWNAWDTGWANRRLISYDAGRRERLIPLHCCELTQRCVDERHEVVATAMACVIKNVEPTGRPALREPPSRLQWSAHVEAAMDQYTGDTC